MENSGGRGENSTSPVPLHEQVAQTAVIAVCGSSSHNERPQGRDNAAQGKTCPDAFDREPWEIGPLTPTGRGASQRTVMKKYPLERKGRRSLDTALEYTPVSRLAHQEPRTATSAVGATRCGDGSSGASKAARSRLTEES